MTDTKDKLALPKIKNHDKVEAALEQEREKLRAWTGYVQDMPDETQEDLDELANIRDEAKRKSELHEAQRKHLKAPALETCRRIDAERQPFVKGWDALSRAAAKRLVDAQRRIEAEREKALAAIAESGGHVDETTILTTHRAPVINGIGRDVVSVEVYDPDLIPDEYWVRVIDRKTLDAAVKAGKEVPGARKVVRKAGT